MYFRPEGKLRDSEKFDEYIVIPFNLNTVSESNRQTYRIVLLAKQYSWNSFFLLVWELFKRLWIFRQKHDGIVRKLQPDRVHR